MFEVYRYIDDVKEFVAHETTLLTAINAANQDLFHVLIDDEPVGDDEFSVSTTLTRKNGMYVITCGDMFRYTIEKI